MLSKVFGWKPVDIDGIELEMYFDYIIASYVVEEELEEMKDEPEMGTGQELLEMFHKGGR
jgi:hypothetical protein